jgi:hypothetical protein
VTLNRNSGIWQPNVTLWGVSPGFESGDLGFTYRTGVNGAHAVLSWRKPTPDRFTRNRQIFGAKFWTWDANRVVQTDGLFAGSHMTFLNYWSLAAQAGLFRRAQDSWQTRGGPAMISPATGILYVNVNSDDRKPVVVSFNVGYNRDEYEGHSHEGGVSIDLKPVSSLRISVGPSFSRSRSSAQYVRTDEDPAAQATSGSRYIFSNLDQTQFSMSTRATWVISPRMSLQVYSQPLLATGDYWNFKALAAPRTFEFTPEAQGPENPDFNFKSLKVNAVFRWEWRLGSTLYVVWTDQREDFRNAGHFRFGRDARHLFGAPADDVLMVKVSYWISR